MRAPARIPGVPTLASLLALDLGTANTVICHPSKGIIYDQPTLIAHDKKSGKIVGIGHDAKDAVGKVSGYVVVERPIREGRIANIEALDSYLEALLRVLSRKRIARPKVVVGVPSFVSVVEVRSLLTSLKRAGFSDIIQVNSVLASAIGLGADVNLPTGSMVVNLGAGTTLSGIVAFGEVVVDSHAPCGGASLDQAITEFMRYKCGIYIDEDTSEELKLALARLDEDEPKYVSSLWGRDVAKGVPIQVEIGEEEVREVIVDPVKRIIDVVLHNLANCPAELAQDLVFDGLHLCGGSSQLSGLVEMIAKASQVPVHVVDEPRYTLAKGLAVYGAYLDN